MIEIRPLTVSDVIEILKDESVNTCKNLFTYEHIKSLVAQKISYVALEDGKPIICAGIINHSEFRGVAWAIVTDRVKSRFIPIHRALKRGIEMVDLARVEATVNYGFEDGYRLVESLGFKMEAPCLKNYNGLYLDSSLYAYVK